MLPCAFEGKDGLAHPAPAGEDGHPGGLGGLAAEQCQLFELALSVVELHLVIPVTVTDITI